MSKTPAQVLVQIDDTGALAKPTTASWPKAVRTMRTDATLALARVVSSAAIISSRWSVEASEQAPEGAVELIANNLLPFRIHILTTAIQGFLDFGWQPYEKVFGTGLNGATVLTKLKPLLQDNTIILVDRTTGAYAGLRQITSDAPIDLAIAESLCLYTNVEGTNWYGRPDMQNVQYAYDSWLDTDGAAKRFDKKVAGAHWVVRYPPGTSVYKGAETDNATIADEILKALRASGTIAIPQAAMVDDLSSGAQWDIQLISAAVTSAAFLERLKYYDGLKVRGLMLPERSLLEGQFGTRAEAQVHADLAITSMEQRHEQITLLLNWHVVNQLLTLNFSPDVVNTVWLQPAPIADMDKLFLRDVYKALLSGAPEFEAGSIDIDSLRDRVGIPNQPDHSHAVEE